jgi:hypothetical protein
LRCRLRLTVCLTVLSYEENRLLLSLYSHDFDYHRDLLSVARLVDTKNDNKHELMNERDSLNEPRKTIPSVLNFQNNMFE